MMKKSLICMKGTQLIRWIMTALVGMVTTQNKNNVLQMQQLQVPGHVWWPTTARPSLQQLAFHLWWLCCQRVCHQTPTTARNPRHSCKQYTPHSHLKWITATATTTASLSQTRHFLDSHSYKISSSIDACQLHSTTNSSYLCLQL